MSNKNIALNARQMAFIDHFLVSLNATEAAKKAGYSEKSARTTASDLLTKPNIQTEIDRRRKEKELEIQVEKDKVLFELGVVGFADFTDFCEVEENGEIKLKDLNALPRHLRKCIKRIDVKTVRTKTKKTTGGEVTEETSTSTIYLHDKLKALDLLGRHFGLFDASDPTTPDPNAQKSNAARILDAARAIAEGRK